MPQYDTATTESISVGDIYYIIQEDK